MNNLNPTMSTVIHLTDTVEEITQIKEVDIIHIDHPASDDVQFRNHV